ncbi:MAG: nucleotide exchange factor GrpE [Candidatus Faecousia sp.]|nr:nucleotide exchange factor GrpE [Candidatus Faecousia sp.]
MALSKKKTEPQSETNEQTADVKKETAQAEQPETEPEKTEPKQDEAKPEQSQPTELEQLQKKLDEEHDARLRLAAEYDNYRKRSQKERDNLYTDIRSETVAKFLPVYDNLERALAGETADTAYKKGVEMTMNELKKIMKGLGVEEFGEQGEAFDPQKHNAVMHVEDDTLEDNVVAEVFQKGFRVGEKVVRFAMVKVAN